MTFIYSERSEKRLSECSAKLQSVFREVLKTYDHTILEGHRPEELQDKAVAENTSTVQWPDSKHNTMPSLAVDAAPFPVDWDDMPAAGNGRLG